ncbi:MAG: Rrf2 family transcriptional regulator [Clostridium argentinense]|uniref:Rrf2 family transcriptional regulator n=1 Tax=Clostridium faecium TaxID=2762223 RepID=A0ABR8YUF5_9CLOT|nr:Rrf2 family transcriptional regulator [Clostridium faecium]MBD8047881.1 Rrf2 family transcriptional regulator [Clostridium faecium]MBS5823366.1 Rrf2 family transcriptional regulator [Clostridium argentinense]MDU1349384.1 Rrf2 family transcriptional regulator [Clostridium argentinense]
MRISAKGRYGLAAVIYMAKFHQNGEYITILKISEALGISKIYLEQTFSLLKRAEIVTSIKGAQGGYRLARMPIDITVFEVLSAIETSLFEKTEETVENKVPTLESVMRSFVFEPLDNEIETSLKKTTLYDLANEYEKQSANNNFMFFI